MRANRPATALASCLALAAAIVLGLATCAEPDAACDDASCAAPPVARCLGDAVITYAAAGRCVGDECRYEASTTDCPNGCVETRGERDGSDVVVGAECAHGEGS